MLYAKNLIKSPPDPPTTIIKILQIPEKKRKLSLYFSNSITELSCSACEPLFTRLFHVIAISK